MADQPYDELIDPTRDRYPCCIVWTPIPVLTWLFPFIGHMGIATTQGVIRDFSGPYTVSEGNMAFGRPTKYLQLHPLFTKNGFRSWDYAVKEASEEYKDHMHNIFCDNCHSHVAMALNLMEYEESTSWNMVKLAIIMLFKGKYVSFAGVLKTWLPFLIIVTLIAILSICLDVLQ